MSAIRMLIADSKVVDRPLLALLEAECIGISLILYLLVPA